MDKASLSERDICTKFITPALRNAGWDLICHIAFDKKPLTRRERAENVKKRDVFTKYGDKARAVLDALLAKYADEGVLNPQRLWSPCSTIRRSRKESGRTSILEPRPRTFVPGSKFRLQE